MSGIAMIALLYIQQKLGKSGDQSAAWSRVWGDMWSGVGKRVGARNCFPNSWKLVRRGPNLSPAFCAETMVPLLASEHISLSVLAEMLGGCGGIAFSLRHQGSKAMIFVTDALKSHSFCCRSISRLLTSIPTRSRVSSSGTGLILDHFSSHIDRSSLLASPTGTSVQPAILRIAICALTSESGGLEAL